MYKKTEKYKKRMDQNCCNKYFQQLLHEIIFRHSTGRYAHFAAGQLDDE